MCGIVGYIAQQAAPILLDGLARLEYRGYDSAGCVAVLGTGDVRVAQGRRPGPRAGGRSRSGSRAASASGTPAGPPTAARQGQRPPAPDARTAGSRSSTTASSTTPPRCAPQLQADGVKLRSDTDTEVLAHLIARTEADTLEDKVAGARRVEGTYGIAVIDADFPDRIVVARNGSPVILGIGEGEMFVASDVAALVSYTRQVGHPRRRRAGHRPGRRLPTFTTRTDRHRRHRRRSSGRGRRTTRASTSTSCTRRSTSSRRRRSGCLRGRLDERFDTAAPRRAEHGRPRGARDPPGQDPRLRLGVLRRPDGRRS